MTIRAISYGAGVQSTALLVLAARREIDYPLALFSNVGDRAEHPKTLAYFCEVAVPYAAKHGIELVELRKSARGKERDLYDSIMRADSRSIGIPVRMSNGAPGRRSCTVDFKVRRIASELQRRGATADTPATVALGISLDEFHRMRSESGIAWERLDYPLIDLRMDRQDCRNLIEREGLSIPPKSSCYFCPFHSLTEWRRLRAEEPGLYEKAVEMERTVNQRRATLGRDAVWFSPALRPLAEVTDPTGQLTFDEQAAACDVGGYCGV